MFPPQSRLRHAVTNTFAIVVFSIMNMLIEMFLSGINFKQLLSSRLVAILVNILIAWLYGVYRALIMRVVRKANPAVMDKKPSGCVGLCGVSIACLK